MQMDAIIQYPPPSRRRYCMQCLRPYFIVLQGCIVHIILCSLILLLFIHSNIEWYELISIISAYILVWCCCCPETCTCKECEEEKKIIIIWISTTH